MLPGRKESRNRACLLVVKSDASFLSASVSAKYRVPAGFQDDLHIHALKYRALLFFMRLSGMAENIVEGEAHGRSIFPCLFLPTMESSPESLRVHRSSPNPRVSKSPTSSSTASPAATAPLSRSAAQPPSREPQGGEPSRSQRQYIDRRLSPSSIPSTTALPSLRLGAAGRCDANRGGAGVVPREAPPS
ncbi:hypothetical protein JHW43_004540 [Diplocarpon mali]|nr:hypothetical protein JHW43_004540 [Diplocarpon mali]